MAGEATQPYSGPPAGAPQTGSLNAVADYAATQAADRAREAALAGTPETTSRSTEDRLRALEEAVGSLGVDVRKFGAGAAAQLPGGPAGVVVEQPAPPEVAEKLTAALGPEEAAAIVVPPAAVVVPESQPTSGAPVAPGDATGTVVPESTVVQPSESAKVVEGAKTDAKTSSGSVWPGTHKGMQALARKHNVTFEKGTKTLAEKQRVLQERGVSPE